MTNNTIPNVPRELLERVLNAGWGSETVNALDDLRDFLESAPSPAGVDGLKVVGYIQRGGIDGAEWEVGGAPESVPVTPIADAQAIIDGLRGEVADLRSMLATVSKAGLRVRTERDQHAQRIGELEGLLRSCLPALSDGGCAALANRIDAAISAVCAAAPNIAPTSEHSSQPERTKVAELVELVRSKFPRIDPCQPVPLDEKAHCCEYTIYVERERLHRLIDAKLASLR